MESERSNQPILDQQYYLSSSLALRVYFRERLASRVYQTNIITRCPASLYLSILVDDIDFLRVSILVDSIRQSHFKCLFQLSLARVLLYKYFCYADTSASLCEFILVKSIDTRFKSILSMPITHTCMDGCTKAVTPCEIRKYLRQNNCMTFLIVQRSKHLTEMVQVFLVDKTATITRLVVPVVKISQKILLFTFPYENDVQFFYGCVIGCCGDDKKEIYFSYQKTIVNH